MQPGDIYEESRCRAPMPRREDLDETGKKIFDHHMDPDSNSIAGLQGPGGIRLHSSRVSEATRALSQYLRFQAGFPTEVREVAILITAREMGSRFEWNAHEPEALKEGVSPEVVDIIKHRKPTDGLPETEQVIIEMGRQLFGEHCLSKALYARAHKIFGLKGLVDLVSLMGAYAGTALVLAAFDMQLPEGQEPLLPMP